MFNAVQCHRTDSEHGGRSHVRVHTEGGVKDPERHLSSTTSAVKRSIKEDLLPPSWLSTAVHLRMHAPNIQ